MQRYAHMYTCCIHIRIKKKMKSFVRAHRSIMVQRRGRLAEDMTKAAIWTANIRRVQFEKVDFFRMEYSFLYSWINLFSLSSTEAYTIGSWSESRNGSLRNLVCSFIHVDTCFGWAQWQWQWQCGYLLYISSTSTIFVHCTYQTPCHFYIRIYIQNERKLKLKDYKKFAAHLHVPHHKFYFICLCYMITHTDTGTKCVRTLRSYTRRRGTMYI